MSSINFQDLAKFENRPISSVPELESAKSQLATASSAFQTLALSTLSAQSMYLLQSFQKKFTKVSSAFDAPNSPVTEELILRMQSALKSLQSLQELIKSNDHLQTPSEIVFPHLLSSEFRKNIRRESLSEEATTYFKEKAPNSLRAIREFMERLHDEAYGLKAKSLILDPCNNFLFAQESLLKLLLLDLIIQGKDPREHTEWFSMVPKETISQIKKEFAQLRKVPNSEQDGKLLRKESLLSKELNDQLCRAVAKATLPRDKFGLVLEYLRLYFNPSEKELTSLLSLLITSDKGSAGKLALRLFTENNRRTLLASLKTVYLKNPKEAHAFVKGLYQEDSDLYGYFLSQLSILSFQDAASLDIEKALGELTAIGEAKYYEEALDALIRKALHPKSKDQEAGLLLKEIASHNSLLCLEHFIAQSIGKPAQFSELEVRLQAVRALIDSYKEQQEFYQHALSHMAFYHVTSTSDPILSDRFLKLLEEITLRDERWMLLEKVALYLTCKYKPEEVVTAIETFLPKMTQAKEKGYLTRSASLHLAARDTEMAKKLAELIPDKMTKSHVLNMISFVTPNTKPHISVQAFGFDTDQIPVDFVQHFLQMVSQGNH